MSENNKIAGIYVRVSTGTTKSEKVDKTL